MLAIWITTDSLLHSNVLVWYDEEVPRSEHIKSENIKVFRAIKFFALVPVSNFEMVCSMLAVSCALDLDAEQDAVVVQDEVIGQEVADWYRDPEATA